MNDFLAFRTMITPILVKVFFWIGVGFSLLTGIILVFSGFGAMASAAREASSGYGGFGGGPFGGGIPGGVLVFLGLLTMVFGPLFTRLSCEFLILLFRIYETLVEIRNRSPLAPPPQAVL